MIERFQYYIDEHLVKKGMPDKAMARSLINKALSRLDYIEKQVITKETASFVFEDIYEALREAGQALMALRGFKPYSHEALISFLREFHSFPASDISTLDRYRALRNKTVYSASVISVTVCNDARAFMMEFMPKLKKEFDSSV